MSCVTFEVAKIVEPIRFYEATRVHLLHSPGTEIFREFYEEVERQVRDGLPSAEIVPHRMSTVADFTLMMSEVLSIIQQERAEGDADIYVNISAGSSEYTAAALLASMMFDSGVVAFNVPMAEYTVPADRVRDVYYDGDTPVGLTRHCREPVMIQAYRVEMPDMRKVVALKVLEDCITPKRTATARAVMERLHACGLLSDDNYRLQEGSRSPKPDQKSTMYYQRNFIDVWLRNGWIERPSKNEIAITDRGKLVLDTFYDAFRRFGEYRDAGERARG